MDNAIYSLDFLMRVQCPLLGLKEPQGQLSLTPLGFLYPSPIAALLGGSGCMPIQIRLEYTVLKYWHRVCNFVSTTEGLHMGCNSSRQKNLVFQVGLYFVELSSH